MSSKLRLILPSTPGFGARTALSARELSPNSRGQGCPRSVRVLVSALAVLVCAHAFAHPYASGLTNLGGTIRFILNEPATDVSVIFGNHAATNALGPLAKGLNSFSLNYNAVTYTNYSI